MSGSDNLFSVRDKVIVVTGVMGQLGVEYATQLKSRGANVVGIDIVDLQSKSLEDHVDTFSLYFKADITNLTELVKVRDKIMTTFGTIDGLINNAALDSPPNADASENGPFEEFPIDIFQRVMDVNVTGTLLCCQVFGAVMAKKGKGSIVNVSSIYGILSPDQSLYEYRRKAGEVFYKPVAYSVSKSAVLNLTRYLAVYWGALGVRTNTIVLGGVYDNQDKEFLEGYNKKVPLGRMADRREYFGSILYLLSDASSYTTGSILVVDGGFSAM